MFPNRPLFQGKEAALPHHGVLHPSRSNTIKCFKLLQKQQNKEQTIFKEKSNQGCMNSDAPPKRLYLLITCCQTQVSILSAVRLLSSCVYCYTGSQRSLVCRNSSPLSTDILSAWHKALFGGQKWTKPLRQSLKSFKRSSATKSACIQRSAAALWLRLR